MTSISNVGAILAGYAILANAIAFLMLKRKGVVPNNLLAGIPGYLFQVCRQSKIDVGAFTKILALTSGLAFLVGLPLLVLAGSAAPYL